jgi:hypothetical protein
MMIYSKRPTVPSTIIMTPSLQIEDFSCEFLCRLGFCVLLSLEWKLVCVYVCVHVIIHKERKLCFSLEFRFLITFILCCKMGKTFVDNQLLTYSIDPHNHIPAGCLDAPTACVLIPCNSLNKRGLLFPLPAWGSLPLLLISNPSDAQSVTLQKYFSHPSLVIYFSCNRTHGIETANRWETARDALRT